MSDDMVLVPRKALRSLLARAGVAPNPDIVSLEAAVNGPAIEDWTCDEYGIANSSAEFLAIVAAVERLIRGDAHNLVAGRAGATALLVVARLAHEHRMSPRATP